MLTFYDATLLSVQVPQTLLSRARGCLCRSRHSPGCGWWIWRGLLPCWWAAALVGCCREPPPLWRSRILLTGSKRLSSATAWKWTSLSWVGRADGYRAVMADSCMILMLITGNKISIWVRAEQYITIILKRLFKMRYHFEEALLCFLGGSISCSVI